LLTALLLITTEIGKETGIKRLLKAIKGVEYTYLLYGAYDVIAKITTESMDELQDIVINHLTRSTEIKSVTRMIILPEKPEVVVLREENAKILA
jgi:DNA-binding Lrp family transcriptional regulator